MLLLRLPQKNQVRLFYRGLLKSKSMPSMSSLMGSSSITVQLTRIHPVMKTLFSNLIPSLGRFKIVRLSTITLRNLRQSIIGFILVGVTIRSIDVISKVRTTCSP